jgi:CMP-N,N'-diacetyllegionaminic acid synthase
MSTKKSIALIPARSGSLRVKGKNIRLLNGHPLIAYTIMAALESSVFTRVVVSTNSVEIAHIAEHYGAEVPFLRPEEYATSTSPDIEWLRYTLTRLENSYDVFSILRPTSPFRKPATIQRAMQQFLNTYDIDSIRAVELCKQHPGKMWVIEDSLMRPLLDQSNMDVAWHAMQYQALPKIYIQNSSLEIARTYVVYQYNSREGKVIAPFLTDEFEGFSIDYESDWYLAEYYLTHQLAELPKIIKEK